MTTPDRLRAVGLRVTRPRVAVLDALAGEGVHCSVEELLAALAARQVRLARASVYNVLDDLVATGLVMLADVGPGRALYEVADDWHHHFVCRRSRQETEVACSAGSRPCLEAGVPGAEIDEAQVIFRGLCADCRAVQTTSVAGAVPAIA
ncbi:MAG: transcriptional repressor [Actinobacteria bacterium]|nr:transcriptional repressor [Actinomycetota bacterium]